MGFVHVHIFKCSAHDELITEENESLLHNMILLSTEAAFALVALTALSFLGINSLNFYFNFIDSVFFQKFKI